MANYPTRNLTNLDSYKADMHKLAIEQDHYDSKVSVAVRRVKVYGKDDQLQIELEKFIPGKKRNTTHYISVVLEGEWIGKFIEACQVEWKPENK